MKRQDGYLTKESGSWLGHYSRWITDPRTGERKRHCAPRFMVRDRDGIYGESFRSRVEGIGLEEVCTTPRSPWQNCYVERVIGSIRRECLNHMIVLDDNHLRRLLRTYFRYYYEFRTHLSLNKDAPECRAIQSNKPGRIVQIPQLRGLHHQIRATRRIDNRDNQKNSSVSVAV